MVQSYLPTILIVVISWVSFWMDVDSVAGRTTLGVTTLLTVSSKASGMTSQSLLCFSCEYLYGSSHFGRFLTPSEMSVVVTISQVIHNQYERALEYPFQSCHYQASLTTIFPYFSLFPDVQAEVPLVSYVKVSIAK